MPERLGIGSLPTTLQSCLRAAAVAATHGSPACPGQLRPLLHCWEAAPGIWEMGGRQEPEQTLKKGSPATMLVLS